MKIEYFLFEIRPSFYGDSLKELFFEVRVNGKKYSFSEQRHVDDLESHYDYYFKAAKEALKNTIEKEKESKP